jgi:hypothetical protein
MTQTPHDDPQPLDAPEPGSEPRPRTAWTRLRAGLAAAAVGALVAVGLGGFAVGRATADDGGTQQPGLQRPGFQQGPPGGQLPGGPGQGSPGAQT